MARCYAHVSALTRIFPGHSAKPGVPLGPVGRPVQPGRHPREPAQRVRLFHDDGPVMHLDPAPPLEAAQRRVDTLPGAPGLMGQFLLAHPEPDDAAVARWAG